jgi:HD-GYP domain-containing protein (c-di-GMP phosphodiesterase class II)/DNA-binding CsgD family transcriptional regulator
VKKDGWVSAVDPHTLSRVPEIRVVEVLAALSLTTDLAGGVTVEKGLRTCLVATAFAGALGLPTTDRTAVFQAALLRSIGCTSHAPENAALFDDDTAFQAALKQLDPGDPAVFGRQMNEFGAWAKPERQAVLARRFLEIAPTEGPRAARASCEVSRALGGRLGLAAGALDALDDVFERFDGLGIPDGRHGEQLSLVARIVHVAEQAVTAHADGAVPGAVAEVGRRAGGHLDPDLAAAFVDVADAVLAGLEAHDLLTAVVAAEPGPRATVPPDQVEQLCAVLGTVVDLKGLHLLGHSAHVATVADDAAAAFGLPSAERASLRAAAHLHDIGRTAVSSAIWDRPGPLGAGDWERVRLHAYWTDRVLRRCPGLAPLAELAAGHHERCDGSGYHRGVRAGDLPFAARLLAAADVFAALNETRPHRPALDRDAGARLLADEAAAGRLDHDACAAVLEGARLPCPRRVWPCALTDREVEVLRLAARGMSNRAIAAELVVSERTVGHHLTHIYDKTGRRTRAGAAVFGIEHGLLPG